MLGTYHRILEFVPKLSQLVRLKDKSCQEFHVLHRVNKVLGLFQDQPKANQVFISQHLNDSLIHSSPSWSFSWSNLACKRLENKCVSISKTKVARRFCQQLRPGWAASRGRCTLQTRTSFTHLAGVHDAFHVLAIGRSWSHRQQQSCCQNGGDSHNDSCHKVRSMRPVLFFSGNVTWTVKNCENNRWLVGTHALFSEIKSFVDSVCKFRSNFIMNIHIAPSLPSRVCDIEPEV